MILCFIANALHFVSSGMPIVKMMIFVFSASSCELFDLYGRERRDWILVVNIVQHLFDVCTSFIVFVSDPESEIHHCFFLKLNEGELLLAVLSGSFRVFRLGVPVSAAPLTALVKEANFGAGTEVALSILVAHQLHIVPLELVLAAPDTSTTLVVHLI
jgi:hypothetical protein